MRKRTAKTIVFAISITFSVIAHAQSSVTLYGIADVGLLYTSKTRSPDTGQNAGSQLSIADGTYAPSLFGLSGIEDIGGGVKVEFKLESGFQVATGGIGNSNGNVFGRQAYLGLSGNFGEVKAGLQFSPFFLPVYGVDPRAFSQFGSGILMYVDNVIATGIFAPNAVSYTSPDIHGLQGSVLLSLGGVAGDFQNGRQYSASLKYDNGTVLVSASYFNANPSTGSALMTPAPTQLPVSFAGRQLGASYKIGSLTAAASFVGYRVGDVVNNVYGGGFNYLATPALDLNAGVWYEQQSHYSTNHSLLTGIGATYSLSRQTAVYAQVAVVTNHGSMKTGLSINNALYGPTGTTTGLNLGIRHTF